MKWIMVFIYLFVIVIIECACCHLYRRGSDHTIFIHCHWKIYDESFCYGLAGLSLFLWSICFFPRFDMLCPKYRLFMVFYSTLRCIFCTFYGHSISSVFTVLHRSCLLSIMLLFWDYHSMLKRWLIFSVN